MFFSSADLKYLKRVAKTHIFLTLSKANRLIVYKCSAEKKKTNALTLSRYFCGVEKKTNHFYDFKNPSKHEKVVIRIKKRGRNIECKQMCQ